MKKTSFEDIGDELMMVDDGNDLAPVAEGMTWCSGSGGGVWRVVRLRKNDSTGGRVALRAWDVSAEMGKKGCRRNCEE